MLKLEEIGQVLLIIVGMIDNTQPCPCLHMCMYTTSIGTNDDYSLLSLCQDAQLQVPAYGQEVELYGNIRCPVR